jgi:hypothetical protein
MLPLQNFGDSSKLVEGTCDFTRFCTRKSLVAAMRQEGKSNIKDASLNDIALAELVSYIFETQRNSKESVVFRLADLVSLYQERLSQLGLKSLPVHTTRLKEKLFNKMPGLKAHTASIIF